MSRLRRWARVAALICLGCDETSTSGGGGVLPDAVMPAPDAARDAGEGGPERLDADAHRGADEAGLPGMRLDAGSDAAGSDAAGSDAAGSDAAGSDAAGSDAAGSDAAGSDAVGWDAAASVDANEADAGGVGPAPRDATVDGSRADAAAACADDDGDGLRSCDGDCRDDDEAIRPGRGELCDGADDDCDGVVDEGCGAPALRVVWSPIEGWPAPGAARPEALRTGGGARAAFDAGGLALGMLPLPRWFALRQAGAPAADGADAYATLELPGIRDFRLDLTLRVDSAEPVGRSLDGTVFGYVGMIFEDEQPVGGFPGSITGLTAPPGELPRLYYAGGAGSGGGQKEVELGVPLQLTILRVGQHLVTLADGVYAGHRTVPDPPAPPARSPLVRLVFACVGCRGAVEALEVSVPRTPLEHAAPAACRNEVRNGDFEDVTEGVPHFWSVRPPDVTAAPCCEAPSAAAWRRALASARRVGPPGDRWMRLEPAAAGMPAAPLVQPLPGLAGRVGQVAFVARADQPAELTAEMVGCEVEPDPIEVDGPPVRIERAFDCPAGVRPEVRFANPGAAAVEVRAVQAGLEPAAPFCTDWRDRYRLPEPTAEPPGVVDLEEGTVTCAAAIDPCPLSLHGAADGLTVVVPGGVELRAALTTRPGAPADVRLEAALGLRADVGAPTDCLVVGCPPGAAAWHVPWAALSLDASVPRTWELALRLADDGRWRRVRARLFWKGSPPWSDALVPPPEYAPVAMAPAWADRLRNFVLHPRRVGPENGQIVGASHFALFRALGLGGVGLVNPHINELEGLLALAAGPPPLAVDLQTFYALAFWRDGPERDFYRSFADAVAAAVEACAPDCPPVHWTMLDEPSIHELADCRTDVSSGHGWETLRPPLRAALQAVGCAADAPCEAGLAHAACRAAFPALIDGLALEVREVLGPAVTVGVNLTADLGLGLLSGFGDALDHLSFTNNWVGIEAPWRWNAGALGRRTAEAPAIPLVAYNVLGGAGGGWVVRGGPSAAAFRGMSHLLVASGALAVRSFVWPFHSAALVDEVARETARFEALAPAIPRQRLEARPPTAHPATVAAVFRDVERTLLVLVNTDGAPRKVRVDLRGLGNPVEAVDVDTGDSFALNGEVLTFGMAPFEGRTLQLESR